MAIVLDFIPLNGVEYDACDIIFTLEGTDDGEQQQHLSPLYLGYLSAV